MITPFDGPIRGGFFLHGLVKPTGTAGAAQLHRAGHPAQDWPRPQLASVITPGTCASKQWGDAFAVRRPGWTPPALTPEQIADDTAAGREFLDYGIGSHVSPVPTWIAFCAVDNSRWSIEVESLGGVSVRLRAKRFGTFGAPAQELIGSSMTLGGLAATHEPAPPIPLPDGSEAVIPIVRTDPPSPVFAATGHEQMRFPAEFHKIACTINKVAGVYSVSASASVYLSSAAVSAIETDAVTNNLTRTYSPSSPPLSIDSSVTLGDGSQYAEFSFNFVTEATTDEAAANGGYKLTEKTSKRAFGVWVTPAGQFEALWCRVAYARRLDKFGESLTSRVWPGNTNWNTSTGEVYSQAPATQTVSPGISSVEEYTLTVELLAGASVLDSHAWSWRWRQLIDTAYVTDWHGNPFFSGTNWGQLRFDSTVVSAGTSSEDALETRDGSTIYTGTSTVSAGSWIGEANVTNEESLGIFPLQRYMHGSQAETSGMAGVVLSPSGLRRMAVRPVQWSSNCVGLVESRATYDTFDIGATVAPAWKCSNGWIRAFPAYAPDHSSDGVTLDQQRLGAYWIVRAAEQWGKTDYDPSLGADPQYVGGPMSSHFLRAVRSAHPGTHAITTSTTEPHDYA